MVFHQRVEEAAAFAEQMPRTAAELYTAETSAAAQAGAEELPASSIDAELYELEEGGTCLRTRYGRTGCAGTIPSPTGVR